MDDRNTVRRDDPGFLKFREQTVPPEQRNWRNLHGHLEAYRRWREAVKENWEAHDDLP